MSLLSKHFNEYFVLAKIFLNYTVFLSNLMINDLIIFEVL